MSITFHCEHCGRKIQAKDDAGGKWGKCPSCKNRLYVPAPAEEDEELKLAPIDEHDEIKQKEMMAETYKLTQDILLEREVLEEPQQPKAPAEPAAISDEKLVKYITNYLKQMANGQLDKAEKTADAIIPGGDNAVDILNQIGLNPAEIPELAEIPQQVLSGLIGTLREKIIQP